MGREGSRSKRQDTEKSSPRVELVEFSEPDEFIWTVPGFDESLQSAVLNSDYGTHEHNTTRDKDGQATAPTGSENLDALSDCSRRRTILSLQLTKYGWTACG